MALNYFDIVVLILLVLFVLRGVMNGLAGEFSGLLGLLVGLVCAHFAYQSVVPYLADVIRNPVWCDLAAYGLVFFAVLLVVDLLARAVSWVLALTAPALLDKGLGAVLGLVRGIVVCAIFFALLHHFLPDAPFFKDALVTARLGFLVNFAKRWLPACLG